MSAPVSCTLTYVTDGPVINNFSLAEGQIVRRPLRVDASVSSTVEFASLSFFVDGEEVTTTDASELDFLWDIRELENRVHRIRLVATDEAGNIGVSEKNIIIDVEPPPAPVITEPAQDLNVQSGPVTVSGSAEPLIPVRLFRNSYVMDETVAGADGSFAFTGVSLIEGSNEIMVQAEDDTGVSGSSNTVSIVLDSGPPAPVIMLEPENAAGAGVLLTWQFSEQGERAERFRLYRNDSDFSNPAEAVFVAETTSLSYLDGQAGEGMNFYAVSGLDAAGNSSELSAVVSINYDGTSPAFSISYDADPPFAAQQVGIILESSEELAETPVLTITPWHGSVSHIIALSPAEDNSYTGSYSVTENFPSGLAAIRVSGRDLAGNSFNGIPAGVDFMVDTDGPVARLVINEEAPVQVTEERAVTVTVEFDEPLGSETVPVLRFQPPEGEEVTVPLSGSDRNWSGTLNLVPDMGSGNGRFIVEAEDSLQNQGGGFSAGEYLEIYNSEFPPPPQAPASLHAATASGGAVELSWPAVALADSYNVYRSDGNCQTIPDVAIAAGLTENSFQDIPAADGIYCYAVTASRRGAESPLSGRVGMLSDRTPPLPPENLTVMLGINGLELSWQPPAEGEAPARYLVYRNGSRIASLDALSLTDSPATGGIYQYTVAAVDEFANENPGPAASFDLTVGAVTDLQAWIRQGGVPVLSWTNHDASVTGYNVYRGGMKLNSEPLAETSYSDEFYTATSVADYRVTAVNADGVESPARQASVYPVQLAVTVNEDENGESGPLVAGYFDQFALTVKNGDEQRDFTLQAVNYIMSIGKDEIFAASDSLVRTIAPAAEFRTDRVIPGNGSSEEHSLRIIVEQQTDNGVQVSYELKRDFADIIRPGSGISMNIDSSPLAGGYATVSVCFVNQGYGDMAVVVSRSNGGQPGDISVILQNEDGLEISRGWYTGLPPGVSMTGDGTAYMNLAAGESFCADVEVLIPAGLPEGAELTFVGRAEHLYSDMLSAVPVIGQTLSGSYLSRINQTEYYGTARTDREFYANDDTIIISGQAINRASGLAEPEAALKIGFAVRGYHWFKEIVTDANGDFVYEYHPAPGLSGHFTVWAAHPYIFDTLRQDEFDLFRMYSSPASAEIRMSKGDSFRFPVELFNPGTAPLTDFELEFNGYVINENGEQIPEPELSGSAEADSGFVLEPGQRKRLYLTLQAGIAAPDNALVEYHITTAEGVDLLLPATVALLPAVPVISVEEPRTGYVDLSLDRGSIQTRSVTVKNTGLRDLLDVEVLSPAEVGWMSTNLPVDSEGKIMLGDIPAGGSKTFDVVFSPPADTDFGYHQDHLVLKGADYDEEYIINLYAMITSNQTGSVRFVVRDMLGNVVEGATIRMRNTVIREDITPVSTDFNGEAVIGGLQEGAWSWQVVAPGHNAVADIIQIIPDQATEVEAVLYRNLVTVEFTVEPVPFTDRYEIKLEQVFETHVPAPVLVLDPPSFTFEDVPDEFEASLLVKVKNKGLIKIHDLRISSAGTPWGSMVPLVDFIPELKADQEVEIPFRLVYSAETAAENKAMVAKFNMEEWADCTLGGFGGMFDALKTLNNVFSGRSFCYGNDNLPIAMGLITFLHIWNAPKDEISVLVNALSCAAQQLLSFDGSQKTSGSNSSKGPSTGSSNILQASIKCFAAGTPVLMADGSSKFIENIAVGDRVASFAGKDDRVRQVYKRQSDHVREIRFRDETGEIRRLLTTDEHLFWTGNRQWQPARELREGDLLLGPEETAWTVTGNARHGKPLTVYNFDVDRYHSYFANGVLVHERCGIKGNSPSVPGSPAEVK